MSTYSDFAEIMRNCNLEMHCHKAKLFQEIKGEKYFELSGYCIIKTNEQGQIWADTIITNENIDLPWGCVIPKRPHSQEDLFTLDAVSITGINLKSSGIRIKTDHMYLDDQAKRFLVPLMTIEIQEAVYKTEHKKWKRSIQFEFKEEVDIPVNKYNTVDSSSGGKSHYWNETLIQRDEFTFGMTKKDGHVLAYIGTDSKDIDKLFDKVLFYLGFMSGVLPQTYIMQRIDEVSTVVTMRSYDTSQIKKRIQPPTVSHVRDQNGDAIDELHYQLLECMVSQGESNKNFECLYSHWLRIWYSFQSKADTVPGITLTTSIEGVLNDIYIPRLETSFKDLDFDREKDKIKEALLKVEEIENKHKETIAAYVERWGNLYPEKALSILSKNGLFKCDEVKAWTKLRNSLAHPRVENSSQKNDKISERVYVCLGIFYKLVFQLYHYHGVYLDYTTFNDPSIKQFIPAEA